MRTLKILGSIEIWTSNICNCRYLKWHSKIDTNTSSCLFRPTFEYPELSLVWYSNTGPFGDWTTINQLNTRLARFQIHRNLPSPCRCLRIKKLLYIVDPNTGKFNILFYFVIWQQLPQCNSVFSRPYNSRSMLLSCVLTIGSS